ncbi:uncharacterized protein FIBRA_01229 [Fibroporia radiculosa]|uniref:Uncharacterized protein n=1 Tax=Fibroporia radiculosa TaxID=599839 RepID=J4H0Z6_9APHY|nr:uncharacterized protein FIBRA_01229 [Fibroporia radiculosa]CCL99214.1 predicted protein [Fibroporia radiculosa]
MTSRDTLADQSTRGLSYHFSDLAHMQEYSDTDEELEVARMREYSHSRPRRLGIPPIIDRRFENSYLQSLSSYVTVGENSSGEKGKARATTGPTLRIQWGRVFWVTTRDQVISPLLQGVARGVAGVFISPLLSDLGFKFRTWWAHGATRTGRAHAEGHGVGWLRNWLGSLTSGTVGGIRHTAPA